jgi:hypothetical protein
MLTLFLLGWLFFGSNLCPLCVGTAWSVFVLVGTTFHHWADEVGLPYGYRICRKEIVWTEWLA